jgi:argininosuccinate lyase
MTPELYATYDAYRAVRAGTPFREAYRDSAKRLAAGQVKVTELAGDFDIVVGRMRPEIETARRELSGLRGHVKKLRTDIEKVSAAVFTA